jgi:hypothetical protein
MARPAGKNIAVNTSLRGAHQTTACALNIIDADAKKRDNPRGVRRSGATDYGRDDRNFTFSIYCIHVCNMHYASGILRMSKHGCRGHVAIPLSRGNLACRAISQIRA